MNLKNELYGTNVIKITGYQSEQTEALKAVAEGIAKGAVKGIAP